VKYFLLTALATILLVIGFFVAFQFSKQSASTPNSTQTAATPTSAVVGSDRDIHGCIGSAGYSWCESKQKCLRVWEEGCPSPEDAELITTALIAKNKWKDGYVTVTLKTNDGRYASGSVPGGYVFAAKANGNWEIVADGNGSILCSQLAKFPDFPTSLIPACYDPATQKEITR
jgi:hypothetical protein